MVEIESGLGISFVVYFDRPSSCSKLCFVKLLALYKRVMFFVANGGRDVTLLMTVHYSNAVSAAAATAAAVVMCHLIMNDIQVVTESSGAPRPAQQQQAAAVSWGWGGGRVVDVCRTL